jgi:hypothetical protein
MGRPDDGKDYNQDETLPRARGDPTVHEKAYQMEIRQLLGDTEGEAMR